MVWLYRLQQRVAITERECIALLVLAGLFGAGLATRAVQRASYPAPVRVSSALPVRAAASTQEAPTAAPARPTDADAMAGGPARTNGGAAVPAAPEASVELAPRADTEAAAQIDINTASAAQLQQLPRIGPKMAERILAYREARGGFARVGELVNVKGIGPKTLARLEPLVSVGE